MSGMTMERKIIIPKPLKKASSTSFSVFLLTFGLYLHSRTSMLTINETLSNMTTTAILMKGGQFVPILQKLAVSREDFHRVSLRLLEAVHPGDVLFLSILGWAAVPLFALFFRWIGNHKLTFHESYLYQFADHISQAAKIALLVYIANCCIVILNSLGFIFSHVTELSQGITKILYIAWGAQRLSVFKRYILGRAVSRKPDKLGRAFLVDRLADGIIYVVTGLFLLDILDVQMGVGVSSIFAFGSAGTLVVGLASRDVAAMFVSGLTLSTSDRIQEGDNIRFGDGTSGRIESIGWMQTTIRGYDELIEVVPNSELGMQRVKNISRVTKCQVKQTLRIRYEDVDKIPQLEEDILAEIKEACPEAITDGSRPFRALWADYKDDHLALMVDTHYEIPPIGQKYWENRQRVMQAIQRAVKKNDVQFVTSVKLKCIS